MVSFRKIIRFVIIVFTIGMGMILCDSEQQQTDSETKVRIATKLLWGFNNCEPGRIYEGRDKIEGFTMDILYAIFRVMSHKGKSRYHIDNLEFECYPAENVSAIWTDLGSGTVDMTVNAWTVTTSRTENFRYSQPFMYDGLSVLTVKETGQTDPFFFFKIFTIPIWLALLITPIFVSILIFGLEHGDLTLEDKDDHHERKKRSYFHIVFHTLYMIFQTGFVDIKSSFARLVQFGFAFLNFAVFVIYTTEIIAYLGVKRETFSVNSTYDFEDRVVKGRPYLAKFVSSLPVEIVDTTSQDLLYQLISGEIDGYINDHSVLEQISKIYCTESFELAIADDLDGFIQANNYAFFFSDNFPQEDIDEINYYLTKFRDSGKISGFREQNLGFPSQKNEELASARISYGKYVEEHEIKDAEELLDNCPADEGDLTLEWVEFYGVWLIGGFITSMMLIWGVFRLIWKDSGRKRRPKPLSRKQRYPTFHYSDYFNKDKRNVDEDDDGSISPIEESPSYDSDEHENGNNNNRDSLLDDLEEENFEGVDGRERHHQVAGESAFMLLNESGRLGDNHGQASTSRDSEDVQTIKLDH